MSPLWNIPFALLVAVAAWSRIAAPAPLVRWLTPVLGFFGVSGPVDRSLGDLFGVAGVVGLVFVAWSDRILIVPDAVLGLDVLLTSLGLGLAAARVLSRAPGPRAARPDDLTETDEPAESRP